MIKQACPLSVQVIMAKDYSIQPGTSRTMGQHDRLSIALSPGIL